jgi:hypothetical protein
MSQERGDRNPRASRCSDGRFGSMGGIAGGAAEGPLWVVCHERHMSYL